LDVLEHDENNNVSKGDVIAQVTTNSYIDTQNKLIAKIGIDNLVLQEF